MNSLIITFYIRSTNIWSFLLQRPESFRYYGMTTADKVPVCYSYRKSQCWIYKCGREINQSTKGRTETILARLRITPATMKADTVYLITNALSENTDAPTFWSPHVFNTLKGKSPVEFPIIT